MELSQRGRMERRALWVAMLYCGCAATTVTATTRTGGEMEALAELSIEELMDLRIDRVYSASRYEQKVTHAPSAVSIVTAEEIARFGYRSLERRQ